MDVVANLSNAIEIAKKLRELSKKIEEADFRMLLADLTDQLGDAKLQAANLKIELAEALGKISELERRAAQVASAEPKVHDGAYVFGDTTRHYCTGCYDTRGQKILLNELKGAWAHFGKWQCPACDKTYGGH
jgi:hypothetical protein